VPAEPQPDAVRRPLLSRTEMRNDRTTDIDTVGTLELLRLLNAEDAVVAGAVAAVLPTLAEVVDRTVARVRDGGHVHYFGAGSSGRIGVLDAAEVVTSGPVPFGMSDDQWWQIRGRVRTLCDAIGEAMGCKEEGKGQMEALGERLGACLIELAGSEMDETFPF